MDTDFEDIQSEIDELELDGVIDQEQSEPVDQEQLTEEDQEQELPGNDPEMIADMMFMGVSELFPMYPTLEKVYAKDKCTSLAEKSCKVADKHGLNMLGFLGKWMEEIILAFTAIGLIKATYHAIDHDMQEAEKQQPEDDEMKEAA